MKLSEEQEIKKEFQLERVILFSDAVFAIIITIMVIDLKLPEAVRNASMSEFQHAFKEILFKFIGYTVTFFLVARFWIGHLKVFSFLKDYNIKLLALNLFFLFCVSLFPFAVTLITGTVHINSPQYGWGVNIYIGVFFLSTIAQCLLIGYMVKNKNGLCFSPDSIETVLKWKLIKFTLYLIPACCVLLVLLNYLELSTQYYIYVIAMFGVASARAMRKFYPRESATDKPFILKMFARRQKNPQKQ